MAKTQRKHQDFLGMAHEDIQQLKVTQKVDEFSMKTSQELASALGVVDKIAPVDQQARLNAVAAKNLLVDAHKKFETQGANDKVSVVSNVIKELKVALSGGRDTQSHQMFDELYSKIGRFSSQDILKNYEGMTLTALSKAKLYDIGIRSQEQIDAVRADGSGEARTLIGNLFKTMGVPTHGLERILGAKKLDKEETLEKLYAYFSIIEKDIKETCADVCDLTKVNKLEVGYKEMLRGAYKKFIIDAAGDIKDPGDVSANIDAFRKSEGYKKIFIKAFSVDTKRMGFHLQETDDDGVVPVNNKFDKKQEGDDIVFTLDPDDMVAKKGDHRFKDPKASFLPGTFSVSVTKGGKTENIDPTFRNGGGSSGKGYTLRVPKSSLEGAENLKISTPKLQPQISYKGNTNVTMEAQTERKEREINIEQKELNDLLAAAPIRPTAGVDPVAEEKIQAPILEAHETFVDDVFTIKGHIPNYVKGLSVDIALLKNGRKSRFNMHDPIISDDGSFKIKIDIFKYGLNSGHFEVHAYTKKPGYDSETGVGSYVYLPTNTPLTVSSVEYISGNRVKVEGMTTHSHGGPFKIGYYSDTDKVYCELNIRKDPAPTTNGGKWTYYVDLPGAGKYNIIASFPTTAIIVPTGTVEDNKNRDVFAEKRNFEYGVEIKPSIDTPINGTEIKGDEIALEGTAQDSDSPIVVFLRQGKNVEKSFLVDVSGGKRSTTIYKLKEKGFQRSQNLQVFVKPDSKKSDRSHPMIYRLAPEVKRNIENIFIPEKKGVEFDTDINSNEFVIRGTAGEVFHATALNGKLFDGTSFVDDADITIPATGILRMKVQVKSSTLDKSVTEMTLMVADKHADFKVTTKDAPLAPVVTLEVPMQFTFANRVGIGLSTVVDSNEILVRGITAPASIAIANGEYQINGGAWTNLPATVNNNDRVRVRTTSSPNHDEETHATLYVGPNEAEFKVKTIIAPVAPVAPVVTPETPDDFNFTHIPSAQLSTTVDSNPVPITGITGPVPITIGGGEYSVNGGRWTNTPGTVSNNDIVEVRVLTAGTFSTPRTATVNIGGRVKEFKVTTAVNFGATVETPIDLTNLLRPRTEAPLNTLIDSNEIVIAGIAAATAISIANGQYRINGGAWTNAPGTVANGDRVSVRARSSNHHGTDTISRLHIGGGHTEYKITTLDALGSPHIDNPNQTVGPTQETFNIRGYVEDPNIRSIRIYNGNTALQTVALRARNPLLGRRTQNAFNARLHRGVLTEGQTNSLRVVPILANGTEGTAVSHAQVMCEIAAGRLTITSPAQGATIEGDKNGAKVAFAGGKTANGARVQVSTGSSFMGIGKGKIKECSLDGNKRTRNTEGLEHGKHTYNFREVTADGREGPWASVSFNVNVPKEIREGKGIGGWLKNIFGGKDKATAGTGTGSTAGEGVGSGSGGARGSGSASGGKGKGRSLGGRFNGIIGGDYFAPTLNKATKDLGKWVDDYPGGDKIFKETPKK